MNKWIAFDIGTEYTGYAVYEEKEDKPNLLRHGFFHIKGKCAKDRFPEMVHSLISLINDEIPEAITVEDFFGGKNFNSIKYLAKLQGFVEGFCVLKGFKHISITASSWRSGCGFHTGRKKDSADMNKRQDYKLLAKEFASQLTGTEITSEDEADAICIGYGTYMKKKEQAKIEQKKLERLLKKQERERLKKEKEKIRKQKLKEREKERLKKKREIKNKKSEKAKYESWEKMI